MPGFRIHLCSRAITQWKITLTLYPALGTDYVAPSPTTLSFTTNETTSGSAQCFTLATLQDDDVEGSHTLTLTLVIATEGTETLGSSLVTIVDDGMDWSC